MRAAVLQVRPYLLAVSDKLTLKPSSGAGRGGRKIIAKNTIPPSFFGVTLLLYVLNISGSLKVKITKFGVFWGDYLVVMKVPSAIVKL